MAQWVCLTIPQRTLERSRETMGFVFRARGSVGATRASRALLAKRLRGDWAHPRARCLDKPLTSLLPIIGKMMCVFASSDDDTDSQQSIDRRRLHIARAPRSPMAQCDEQQDPDYSIHGRSSWLSVGQQHLAAGPGSCRDSPARTAGSPRRALFIVRALAGDFLPKIRCPVAGSRLASGCSAVLDG